LHYIPTTDLKHYRISNDLKSFISSGLSWLLWLKNNIFGGLDIFICSKQELA
jgi:hypothetical protein